MKKNKLKVKDLVYMAAMAAVISVCAWISIPAAVPFTLQTFAVFFSAGLLGGKRGTVSVAVYIVLGLVGVPVFSGFKGGPAAIIGTTGGYILGFIFIGLVYWLFEAIFPEAMRQSALKFKNVALRCAALAAGLVVCYAFGTAWFMIAYARSSGPLGLAAALGMCVVPFIIPDLAKMAAAIFISGKLKRFIK